MTPSVYTHRPPPLLEVRVHLADLVPAVRGLCTGYDRGAWRNDDLAGYLFEYLPDFALRHGELGPEGHEMWVAKLVEAARTVYTTGKFQRRGEFGELLLHAVIREIWPSEPAVSKIYYKDGPNQTVKGFDAVHAVLAEGSPLELLLGEVKFYRSIDKAMTDAAKELRDHFGNDEWLRSEFVAVTRKLDHSWPHAAELRELLHRRRTLDEIVSRVRVPVLLTYESACVDGHTSCSDAYCEQLAEEIAGIRERFSGRTLPKDVTIELLLVPMHRKADLIKSLETRLRAWRLIA
ncbi:MAG: hypothetical protein JWO74_1108 [Solirubrobacterales bacterium]|nr:hypothetical protein [Solirubrobacterales bacterium]